MSHFHLKYFPRTGPPKTNLHSMFHSEMDALDAAGLANATRGKESGYYGIEECRIRVCKRPRKEKAVAVPRSKAPTVSPRPKMLN